MKPFPLLLLAFFSVPLLEIYLLLSVGHVIGALPTLLLVIVTAVLGATLLRRQGWATWQRVRAQLAAGQMPTQELAEGVLLLLGSVLLLTPGFITDALGLLCLLPKSRRWLVRQLLIRLATQQRRRSHRAAAHAVIDGEWRREDG